LTVPGEQQVMLKVRVAELSRTAIRKMNAQLTVNSGNLSLSTATGISAVFSSVLNAEDVTLALTAVNTTGYTKVLAEPNLVTLNGQPASFLAGGEFPVPTAVGIGGVSGVNTQFRSFGAQLTFTPTIIDKDRIRLAVAPSVSSINTANSVNNIPGLNTRSVSTTVDLRVGQWLAIAGLLQTSQNGTKTRVPFVGDIPVVGALFGSATSQNDETELIVLVSPELVHPLDAQETPLLLPGMEIAEPSDAAFFLGGAYVAKWQGEGDVRGAAFCRPRLCGQSASRAAGPEIMSRPEYQRSEKYYLYGQHGLSH
jgi:pilus assembly protein CpaC